MVRRKRVLDDGDDSDSPGSVDDMDFDLENDPNAGQDRVPIEDEDGEDDDEKRPRMGIGSKGFSTTFSKAGIGSRAEPPSFVGSLKDGIGSKPSHPSSKDSEDMIPPAPSVSNDTTPSAFNKRAQSFTRESNPSPRPVSLPASELAHFSKIQNSFGARMLAKMGWQAGTGLGVTGEGIVTPIESKLRPQKMGIAFKGFKEKTEQSKMEAKRRGDEVSDDEDEKTKRFKRKAKEQAERRSDVWKRPKKSKIKIEHKTYEQIIAEAEEVAAPGIGQIIDATGAVVRVCSFKPVTPELIGIFEPREVTSLADVSLNTWSPSNDPTRIPEVRHNVRLIADACKGDLDGLAREAKALQERSKFVNGEDVLLVKKVEHEAQRTLFFDLRFQITDSLFLEIARLQQVQLIANDINGIAKELTSVYEVSLEPFSPHFQRLISEYSYEYDEYRLDEIVVAAIAPIVRRMAANWNPLEQPSLFLSPFRSWQHALKINDVEIPSQAQVDVYGAKTTVAPVIDM